MNFSNTASNAAARVFSLALKGVNVKPGFFLKTAAAAPAPQAITGVGFTPRLIMLASVQNTTQANPVAHSRFGLGASDGGTEGSSAVQDQNAAGVTIVDAIDKTSKIFVKVDNSTPVIDAEADLASRGTDGFTLNWTTNDAVQTEILYLAMAPLAVTEVRLIYLHRHPRATWGAPGVADGVRGRQPRLPPVSRDRRPPHADHAVARRGIGVDGRVEEPRHQRAELQLLGCRRGGGLAGGDLLARGCGLQRQEHLARSDPSWRADGGPRSRAEPAAGEQPDADRTRARRRPSRGTVYDLT